MSDKDTRELIEVEAESVTSYEEAFRTHQRIKTNGNIACAALVEVCKDLKKMRDEKLYKELGYEDFDTYCDEMAGIKSRMAYNYISAYENLGSTVLQSNANLGITKLELISRLNPVERAEGLADGTYEGMSVSEIKELVKKNKQMGEQINLLTEENEKLQDEINELEISDGYDAEKDEAIDKVKELEEQLRNAKAGHIIELDNLRNEYESKLNEVSAPDDTPLEQNPNVQKLIEKAVKDVKKDAKQKAEDKVKTDLDKHKTELQEQAKTIESLKSAIAKSNEEKQLLEKQLALADTNSTKAMVYIQAIQENFNALFALISDMNDENKTKFNGAVNKLIAAMQNQVG